MKYHRNIPFFVPHAGCPNCCVFCSQVKITGERAEKNLDTEVCELRALLESESKNSFSESQIGFFGGSFTAIDRTRMEKLLSVANEYIDKGIAEGIRISTRPDCIDGEILAILKKYRVTHIELGVQSTDERVLAASNRGHSARDSFDSARMINENRFVFGGQMMIGLPESSAESEEQTARDIVKMGAKEARIYPTVVFEGTKLYDMTVAGKYEPLTLIDAVERTARCYKIFYDNGVNVLRVGLHSSENLVSAPFGANHPSIGELVKSYVYADIVAERAKNCKGKTICIEIKKSDVSMLFGHGRAAINRIIEKTGALNVEVLPTDAPRFEPIVRIRSV